MSDTKPKDGGMMILRDALRLAAEIGKYRYRETGDEPRFISTQEEADEAFGVGRVTVGEPEPPMVYGWAPPPALDIARASYEELQRLDALLRPADDGIYWPTEQTEPAAECGKEGPMEWTDANLVEALKESAEWARARLDVAAIHRGIPDEQSDHYIPGDVIRQKPDFLSHATQKALRVLAESIRTGAIYGSAERCAACGGADADSQISIGDADAVEPDEKCRVCNDCKRYVESGVGEVGTLAAAILRARRLLGERRGTTVVTFDPGPTTIVNLSPAPLTTRERWEASASGGRWKATRARTH